MGGGNASIVVLWCCECVECTTVLSGTSIVIIELSAWDFLFLYFG